MFKALFIQPLSAWLLLIVLTSLSTITLAQEPLKVLHTLKPLELISQELLVGFDDTGEDAVQLQRLAMAASHNHSYSAKFSDLHDINAADLLVWLGPEFEHHLAKPLDTFDPRPSDFHWLGGSGESHSSESDHSDEALEYSHVWLDPLYVAEKMPQLAKTLGELRPALVSQLNEAAKIYAASLHVLHAEIAKELLPYRGTGIVSDHGGLEVFLQRFGLRHMGSLRSESHGSLSLQRLRQLRADIELENTRCLAVGSAEDAVRADALSLFSDLNVPVVKLDLMGLDAQSYAQMLRTIAAQLKSCLSAAL